jgi:hypothetical protein
LFAAFGWKTRSTQLADQELGVGSLFGNLSYGDNALWCENTNAPHNDHLGVGKFGPQCGGKQSRAAVTIWLT